MDLCSLHSETSPLDHQLGRVDVTAEKEHGCSMGTAEIHGLYIHGKCGHLWSMQEDKTRLVHFIWITLGVLITNLVLRAAWLSGSYLPNLCFASSSSSLHQFSSLPVSCPLHMPVWLFCTTSSPACFPLQTSGSYAHCCTSLRAPSKMQSYMKFGIHLQ